MRRGVWVVLGLMGAVPGAALAQQAPRQAAEQTQGGSQGQQASDSSGAGTGQQQAQGRGGVIEAAGTSDPALGTSGGLWGRDTSMTPAQAGTALPDNDTSGIALEVPRGGVAFPGVVGARRSQALQAQSGMGGSGQSVRAPALRRPVRPTRRSSWGR